jgi:predicted nucleic acid-binding protein
LPSYTVVYDACVLYPAPLRDLLIQLATANLFRAKWTDEIHEEWIANLLADRDDLDREQLLHTRRLMDIAVMDALVFGYQHLTPSIELPDPNDRHVVAAAIHARADAIVTTNLKDFPAGALHKYNLEAIHPDEFIAFQKDLDESAVVTAAQRCRRRLKKPPKTPEEYLLILQRQSLPKTAEFLRSFASVI